MARGLEARSLEVAYGKNPVLRGVSLSAAPGHLLTILGPNGAGKSTLMRTLAGLLRPRAGTIHLGGQDITATRAHQRVKMGVALVPEGRGMLPSLSVRDNLELGTFSRPYGRRRAELGEDLERVFALFPVLRERQLAVSGGLSGGQMQMLAIARALMSRPRVLLLDEPTLGLAPIPAEQVLASLSMMLKDGMAVVVVEQKARGLIEVADHLLLIRQGRIERDLSRSEITNESLVQLYFGGKTEA